MTEQIQSEVEVRDILRQAKHLAVRYRELTGKPLGVTGEVAELAVADCLGCALSTARTPGYDAILVYGGVTSRLQIKGRAVSSEKRYRGMCPSIKSADCDLVALVLLNQMTLDVIEIWIADIASVVARLDAPGGKARNIRRAMAITQFKSIACRVWPIDVAGTAAKIGSQHSYASVSIA